MIQTIAEILFERMDGIEERAELNRIQSYLNQIQPIFQSLYEKYPEQQTGLSVLRHPGKQLRGFLTFLIANHLERIIGGPQLSEHSLIHIAASAELFHLFTLIHDDIIDRSEMRRGIPTAYQQVGASTAIILGDLLFCEAINLLVLSVDQRYPLTDEHQTLRRIQNSLRCGTMLCEGQIWDIRSSELDHPNITEYFHTIDLKTGIFFEFIASSVLQLHPKARAPLLRILHLFGRLFQVSDDFADVSQNLIQVQKFRGTDIQQGIKSLPIILLINEPTLNEADRIRLQDVLDRNCSEPLSKRVDIIRELCLRYEIVEASLRVLREILTSLNKELDGLRSIDPLLVRIFDALREIWCERITDV